MARTIGHAAFFVLVGAAALINPPRWQTPVSTREDDAPQVVPQTIVIEVGVGRPELSNIGNLLISPSPVTNIPQRQRREIEKYTVQPNDNVSRIAEKYALKPETILWANPQIENDPDLLSIGQVVTILPINGVYHNCHARRHA